MCKADLQLARVVLAAARPAVEFLLLQQAGVAPIHLRRRCTGSQSALSVQATEDCRALMMDGRQAGGVATRQLVLYCWLDCPQVL